MTGQTDILQTTPRASTLQARRTRRDRVFAAVTILVILAAWLYGYYTSGVDVAPLAAELMPEAAYVEKQGDLFVGYNQDRTAVTGYAAAGEAPGYSGPVRVLVALDAEGVVTGVKVIRQSETPGFFRLVANSDLLTQFVDRAFDRPFRIGEDIDAVSGATLSAEGVAAAARQAIRQVADQGLDRPLPAERRAVEFGGPEIVLLLLFAVGYFAHKLRGGPWKGRIRWATLLTGMVVLGFIYTAPFTITMVVALLSGFWPDWHTNLYWYLLVGGILFVTLVDGKNPYCGWFCPFGAAQECLGAVTGAKLYRPKELHLGLKWLQRGLALTAIVLGLALRRPGVAGYEPFATLFDFQGSGVEWVFLAVVLLGSLLVFRPFCNYLCPLDPVVEFVAVLRKWGRESWRKRGRAS